MSEPTPSRELRGAAIFADPLVSELLTARLVGLLATLEPDGSVHAVPMWLAAEDGAIVLASGSRSRKVRNLERDDRATLALHDSRSGCEVCGTSIRGRVEIVRLPEAPPLIELVHERYLTAVGLGLTEVQTFLQFDDIAIRLHPETAITWDERESAAAQALRAAGGALPLEPTAPR